MDLCLGLRRNVAKTLQAEDVGKGLDARDFGRAEFCLGLFATRAAPYPDYLIAEDRRAIRERAFVAWRDVSKIAAAF